VNADDRYVVISSDGHAGADLHEYRDYLEQAFHEEFDEWVAAFVSPWADLRQDTAYRNWDSSTRLRELEDDGVVAEVLFPNTIPPFFPMGNLLLRPPANAEEYRLRWAGLKAHNRWMVDFAGDTPGRRAGMAQILLNDVDDAVAEIEWAAGQGLFGGILLPGVPPDCDLPPLYAPDYDPIWAACQAHGMPINNHSGSAGPAPAPHVAGMAVFMVELGWFSHRVFWHLAFGGVFERFPGVKLVLTEQSCGWVPKVLEHMDHTHRRFQDTNTAESHFGAMLLEQMPHPPSHYWHRNCFAGASFFRPSETPLRHEIGVDRIMWGQDYPHIEGTYPYTTEALRHAYAGVEPDEVAAMVGRNAAEVYGFDLDVLQPVAERVGPTVAEVVVPLDEIPADSRSIAFSGEAVKPW
jgi:predicted TIM-barrel fold metal-dependent hydrolase